MNISRKIVENLLPAQLSVEEVQVLTSELETITQLTTMLRCAQGVGCLVDGEDVRL